MLVAKVIGNVWATRKEDSLSGMKLMVVRRMEVANQEEGDLFVAVDLVGAGVGEMVLVSTGSSARNGTSMASAPVDAAIVGIIDQVEVTAAV
jgi:ethanolamine utilization protein EutN